MIVLHIKTIEEYGFCGAQDGSGVWHDKVMGKIADDLCEECYFIWKRLPFALTIQVVGIDPTQIAAWTPRGCRDMGCNGGGLHVWVEPRTWLPWPHWAFRRLFPRSMGGPL